MVESENKCCIAYNVWHYDDMLNGTNNATIGLNSLRTQAPVENPQGKLVRFLLEQSDKALAQLLKGNATAAQVELEYALHEADITLQDNPKLLGIFYRTSERNIINGVICPKCGGYVPGHATGNADICTCDPITTI